MGSSESKQYKDDEDLASTPMQCNRKSNDVKNISEMDPRSPNFSIIRTPIEVPIISSDQTEGKTVSQMKIAADPRSPSDEFPRTPILIQNPVVGQTPLKLHNKILDNARRSIYYTPTMTSKINKDIRLNHSPIPPKLLESSPIYKKNSDNRKSFVGLLETNIDYTETDLDNIKMNPFSSGLTINTNEKFLASGNIIEQECCDPRSPSTEFLRTPIQIIKKIGEVDLNKTDEVDLNKIDEDDSNKIGDAQVENYQEKETYNSESLLKIAIPCVESIEVKTEKSMTLGSDKDGNLEKNNVILKTIYDFEKLDQENSIDTDKKEGNNSLISLNRDDAICEDVVLILNDLIDYVETSTLEKNETNDQMLFNLEDNDHKLVIDLTADVREFDRKLTKIIYEENENYSFKNTPRSEKQEKPRNRTPMKDRNIIEEPKRNKLRVSDKPRKLDSVSKIPIFRENNCENTIPLGLGVRKKKKSHQPKWDSDKTLVI